MFGSRISSPLHPSFSHHSYTSSDSGSTTTAPLLPTGGCQFILLHSSTPDQRCSCQGFRLHENLPGAHCECGHQACYHSHDSIPHSTTECNSASYSALMDKMRRLEAQYEHERKIWQEELNEERRARREDIRVLREAMYSLYEVVERDIPRQFEYVEDKIEGLVDCQQQLRERVMTVDDSIMALEDRVASLEEDEQDSNDEGAVDDDEEDEVVGESTEQYGTDTAQPDASLAGQTAVFPASGGDEASIKSAEASRTHPDDQDPSFQLPPNLLYSVNPTQLRRKRHGVDHEMAESTAESRHSFTLPSPPPLSLSSPDQAPARCHSEPSIAPYSSFGLTS